MNFYNEFFDKIEQYCSKNKITYSIERTSYKRTGFNFLFHKNNGSIAQYNAALIFNFDTNDFVYFKIISNSMHESLIIDKKINRLKTYIIENYALRIGL